jgi:gamma-glutamyl hercynylcysteine S-oxide hydrolase
MCRLAAYVGEHPISLSALLYDAPHSLQHAAYAPAEMTSGHVNVDGTGVAWWPNGNSRPLRYVTTQPPWSDPNLPALAPRLTGSTVISAVRSATPGMPFGHANVAPFVDGDLAGAHNGWIAGFSEGLSRELTAMLSDGRFGRLEAVNDSLVVFSLVAQILEDHPELTLADAVAETLQRVTETVIAARSTATLNLVVASSSQIVTTRTSIGHAVNSLYIRQTDEGMWLASEPLDNDDRWMALPEHSLAILTASDWNVESLGSMGSR